MSATLLTEMTEVAIVGAGLVGPVLAIMLIARGFAVKIYECRGDPRKKKWKSRSVNLTLSKRGLDALEKVGLKNTVLNGNSVPIDSRLVYHSDNSTTMWRYGREGDFLHSIERNRLHRIVLDEAEHRGAKIFFKHKVVKCNVKEGKLTILKTGAQEYTATCKFIFGCDGVHSVVRMQGIMQVHDARFCYEQKYIPYGYKELRVPPQHDHFALIERHLHLWPRGKCMLIGMPNPDKSMTLTLFMPFEKFEEISTDSQKIVTLFTSKFPGILEKLGGEDELIKQYSLTKKVQELTSLKCRPHHVGQTLILGDAAHAMVPFYGQGVNAGFEDCLILDSYLKGNQNDLDHLLKAVELYAKNRPKDSDAIVTLSLYNFNEMMELASEKKDHLTGTYAVATISLLRDLMSKRIFQVEKQVIMILSYYTWITPLYSMVAFTRLPYHEVVQKHMRQMERLRKTLILFILIIAAMLYFCLPFTNLLAVGSACSLVLVAGFYFCFSFSAIRPNEIILAQSPKSY